MSAAALPDLAQREKPKITMSHFLKDSGTGVPMSSSLEASKGSSTKNTPRSVTPVSALIPSRSVTTVVAPQVRIIDGEIVVDEDSLLTSVPPPSSDLLPMDVIHETGRHLTSHAFVKTTGNNRWKSQETVQFYEALSMCGTDFSLISMFFPHKSREQIKGKYKIEERTNPDKVAIYLKNRKPIDMEWIERVQNGNETKEGLEKRGRGRPKAFGSAAGDDSPKSIVSAPDFFGSPLSSPKRAKAAQGSVQEKGPQKSFPSTQRPSSAQKSPPLIRKSQRHIQSK
jgi:hypothetical protein